MKHWKHGIAAALAVAIGMALAAPPAFARTCGEVDVGKDASAKKDLGAKTASDNMAQEGVVLNAIAGQTLAIQDAKNTITDHAATMKMLEATITASTAKLDVDTATALADAGVKAIPVVAHATQVAISAEQEVAIAEKAGGDASGAELAFGLVGS